MASRRHGLLKTVGDISQSARRFKEHRPSSCYSDHSSYRSSGNHNRADEFKDGSKKASQSGGRNRSYYYEDHDRTKHSFKRYKSQPYDTRNDLRNKLTNLQHRRHYYSNFSDESLNYVIKKMLKTEDHHIIEKIYNSSDELTDVLWCPVYVRPDIQRRILGGRSILHHKCRRCRRICFHLLYEKGRPCLECAGWKLKDIPGWYYHQMCRHCTYD